MTEPTEKIQTKYVEFSYILGLVMVLIAGRGLHTGKLTGAEWVAFTGIITAAYGFAEYFKRKQG